MIPRRLPPPIPFNLTSKGKEAEKKEASSQVKGTVKAAAEIFANKVPEVSKKIIKGANPPVSKDTEKIKLISKEKSIGRPSSPPPPVLPPRNRPPLHKQLPLPSKPVSVESEVKEKVAGTHKRQKAGLEKVDIPLLHYQPISKEKAQKMDHGEITVGSAKQLLKKDGDFLVRTVSGPNLSFGSKAICWRSKVYREITLQKLLNEKFIDTNTDTEYDSPADYIAKARAYGSKSFSNPIERG